MFARPASPLAHPRTTIAMLAALALSVLGTLRGVPPPSLGGHAGPDVSKLGRWVSAARPLDTREVQLSLVVLADGSLRPLPRNAVDLSWDALAPLVNGSVREISLRAWRVPRLSGMVGLTRSDDGVRIEASAARGAVPGPFGEAELSAQTRERLLHIFADDLRTLGEHQNAPELRSLAERIRAGGTPTTRWKGVAHEALFWLSALGALLSLGWLSPTSAYRAARALRQGECPKCRYDLRGLDAPVKCPECGSAWP
jgi:hypothetical protein